MIGVLALNSSIDKDWDNFTSSFGVTYLDMSNMEDENGTPAGVRVGDVLPGGAAEKAGLQEGDIITEFDGNTVTTKVKLETAVNSHESGYMADITVQREVDGEYQTLTGTITLNGPSK